MLTVPGCVIVSTCASPSLTPSPAPCRFSSRSSGDRRARRRSRLGRAATRSWSSNEELHHRLAVAVGVVDVNFCSAVVLSKLTCRSCEMDATLRSTSSSCFDSSSLSGGGQQGNIGEQVGARTFTWNVRSNPSFVTCRLGSKSPALLSRR